MERLNFAKFFGDREPPKPGEMEQMRADSLNGLDGDLNAVDGYDCRRCRNKGYVMTVKEDNGNFYMVSVPCKCMTTRNAIMRMKRSGLESLIGKCKFETYEATEPWQKMLKSQAMEFAAYPVGWFYLGGQSGCGKTHLCTAICRKLLQDGKDVLYMVWRDEIPKLKAAQNTDEYSRMMGKLKGVEVLYIDDLFKVGKMAGTFDQRPTPADQQIAFELLNYRINNNLTTIISSECTVNDLLDIDEATGGRIIEGSHAYTIGRDRAKNWRLRNAKEL